MTSAPQRKVRSAHGWRMSVVHRDLFLRLWSDACEAQGWHRPTLEREAIRHQILEELGFSSARDIGTTDGFDAVKAEFERLADVVHNERDDAGQRRRITWRINQTLERLRAAGYLDHSIQTILVDRFKIVDRRTIA